MRRRLRAADLLEDAGKVDALGPLNGQAEGAVPDELGERAEAAADAESGSVVERLLEAVVVEENAGGAVDVGEGVLCLRGC